MKILHVISSLAVGGAETSLMRLLAASDRQQFHPMIVSLMPDDGAIADYCRGLGIPVSVLGTAGSNPLRNIGKLSQLLRWVREFDADIVQTWMYHSNLAGGVAARLAGRPLIWCVRQADLDARIPLSTNVYARLGAALSRWLPARVVFNSEAGRNSHVAAGYGRSNAQVIANGFDLQTFHPDPGARASVRTELGLPADTVLVGLIARFDPQKDHANFVAAAALVGARFPAVRFLLCGKDVTPANAALAQMIASAGLRERVALLGHRTDIARLNASLDVACLSSRGEGFPNTVGEAMACGVPCVATNVGDVALLVGDAGVVVPPKDPEQFAAGIGELLLRTEDSRRALGAAARRRIEEKFSIAAAASAYQELWRAILAERAPQRGRT